MSRPRRLSLTPTNPSMPHPTPPPTPKPVAPDPESTVSLVLTRLHTQHPTLAPPTVAEIHRFLEKTSQAPDLPEWIWYGMLHYAVEQEDGGEGEKVDFGILDDVLDTDIVERGRGGRVLDMLFFYMYLFLESGRGREEKEEEEMMEEEEEVHEKVEERERMGERERRTEGLGTEGVVTPPVTEDGSGSEGVRTVRRRKMSESWPQQQEEEERGLRSQQHQQEQQQKHPQQRSTDGIDIKSIIIFLLLITIGLLLAFPPNRDAFVHVRRPCEQAYFGSMATFSQFYAQAVTTIAQTYRAHCQEDCQRIVDLLVDNARYRLGTLELPGGETTARSEL